MSEKFNNPFEKLKALKKQLPPSQEPAQKSATQKPTAQKTLPAKPAPTKEAPTADDDAQLFQRYMANTKPLRPSTHGKTVAVPREDKRVTQVELLDLASALDDSAKWQCYDDGAGEIWHAPGVSEKLLIDFRRGAVPPSATLDLHGMRALAAERAIEYFVREQAQQRASAILIITGKGENGEGVLRQSLGEWLRKPTLVRRLLAYCAAPRALGGDGATLVALRRRSV